MTITESFKLDWQDAIVLACLLLCAIGLYCAAEDVIDVDDAYISYRYAANLASGVGPVCNAGEHVYGSTTLAWVGWLAMWSWLTGGGVDRVSSVSSLVFLAVNCMLFYFLMRRLTAARWLSAAAALLLLATPQYLLISTLGMETMFYVFFILLSFWCYSFERCFLAGIAAGGAFCVRPDGLAVFAALVGTAAINYYFVSRSQTLSARLTGALRSGPARLAIGFLLVAVPFVLFCYAYYGAVLPHTLQAKRMHPLQFSRWWMLKHFVTGPGWPVTVGIVFGMAAFVMKRLRKTASDRTPGITVIAAVMLWLGLYVIAWTIVRIDMYPWYLAALGPASVLAVFLPLTIIPPRNLALPLRVGLWIWIAVVGVFWSYKAYGETLHFAIYLRQVEFPRLETALAVNRYTKPGKERIGTGAIGVIGYHCRSHALHDFASLVTTRDILNDPATQPTLLVMPGLNCAYSQPCELHAFNMGSRMFEYEIVHTCASPTLTRPFGPTYLEIWVRQDASTWDVARCPPTRPIGASFGESVQLIGVNPIRTAVDPGESVRCQVLWRFDKPLGNGARMRYSLSREGEAPVAQLETVGFFRNARPFQRVRPGESVLDFVEIPLAAAPPGRYRLNVVVMDQGRLRPDEAHRERDQPYQVRLIEVDLHGAGGK